MAISAGRVTERVIARIRSSEYLLTVFYPVQKARPSGPPSNGLPASPLLASAAPTAAVEEFPERINSEVVMQCLFTDTLSLGDYRKERVAAEIGGWSRQTTAVARVTAADAERPEGGTVFDGCDYVEVRGSRYKVLSVVRQAASTTAQGTYYVLLSGDGKS